MAGDLQAAVREFRFALAADPACQPARLNLALLQADMTIARERSQAQERVLLAHASNSCQRLYRPKVLVLLITYNRLEYTRLALDALLSSRYPNLTVVVWDNASRDGTVEYITKRLASVQHARLELCRENAGVVRPMNAVWASNRDAELLAKIDNDTLTPPGLIDRLVNCHLASDRFGVLSGFHFRAEGEAIAPQQDVVTVGGVQVLRQQFVGGCAVMVRRDVYERFGAVPETVPVRRETSIGYPTDRPFMESGWTVYQRWLTEAGLINGYPWPPVHVDHMEDTRSPHCVRSSEHEQYKRAMRGMSLDEFTEELCVWRPH
jgi:glycosyltransferase involved in cell wall biosynthesis